jgi:hypothetical protein
LTISALDLAVDLVRIPATDGMLFGVLALVLLALAIIYAVRQTRMNPKNTALLFLGFAALWLLLSHVLKGNQLSRCITSNRTAGSHPAGLPLN